MEQACGDIARIRGIPRVADGKEDIKELVRQYLSAEAAGQWLLIVDNADDMDLLFGTEQSRGIADYLPRSESGLILFTTRYQEMAVSLADSDIIEVEEMDRQEAVSFLEKSLVRKQILDNDATTIKLLDELTYLPLAIAQASSQPQRRMIPSRENPMNLAQSHSTEMILMTLMTLSHPSKLRSF